jgi:hypothetical protein
MMADADADALAHELLVAGATGDVIGIRGAILAVNDLSEDDRYAVFGAIHAPCIRALRELASVWGMSADEVVRILSE